MPKRSSGVAGAPVRVMFASECACAAEAGASTTGCVASFTAQEECSVRDLNMRLMGETQDEGRGVQWSMREAAVPVTSVLDDTSSDRSHSCTTDTHFEHFSCTPSQGEQLVSVVLNLND